MTQDEIIEMARQSDLGFLLGDSWMMHHELEAFAKLVAAKAIREHAMYEVQRLGQEIEQEPVAFAGVEVKPDTAEVMGTVNDTGI